jgi:pyruvate/2-oxoglutarate dehydrogenase complex dihydrolipoamide acyltransferase (E2) component
MKIGAENRKKLFAAVGLMVLAVVVLLFSFGGSAPPPATAPTTTGTTATTATPAAAPRPAATSRTAAGSKAHAKKASPAARSLDPTLRYDWLKGSEDTKYEGTGRNIFMTQAEIPQPIVKPQTDEERAAENQPPPPPPPPPINLKFFGFASKPGEAKKIFLSEGEDVFIAAEGEVVDRHYKVVRISPTSVEIEDVLNNNRQSIPLTLG